MVPDVTITHESQVACLVPLGVEGAFERSAICKGSYNYQTIFPSSGSSVPALSRWSVAMTPASRIYGRRRGGDSSLWGESASLPVYTAINSATLSIFIFSRKIRISGSVVNGESVVNHSPPPSLPAEGPCPGNQDHECVRPNRTPCTASSL